MEVVEGDTPITANTRLILSACGSVDEACAATVSGIRRVFDAPSLEVRVAVADAPLNGPAVFLERQGSADADPSSESVVLTASSAGRALATFSFSVPVLGRRPGIIPSAELETLAAASGAALRGAQLSAEVARAADLSGMLCDTVRLSGVAASLPIDDLCATIKDLAARLAPSEFFALYVVDSPRREVLCVESTFPPFKRSLRMRLGEGVAGTVAATARTVRVSDGPHSPLLSRPTEGVWGRRVENMLCLPVLAPSLPQPLPQQSPVNGVGADRRVLAVIQFANKLPACSSFSDADERAIAAWARELASVLLASERGFSYAKLMSLASARGTPDAQVDAITSVLLQFWQGRAVSGGGGDASPGGSEVSGPGTDLGDTIALESKFRLRKFEDVRRRRDSSNQGGRGGAAAWGGSRTPPQQSSTAPSVTQSSGRFGDDAAATAGVAAAADSDAGATPPPPIGLSVGAPTAFISASPASSAESAAAGGPCGGAPPATVGLDWPPAAVEANGAGFTSPDSPGEDGLGASAAAASSSALALRVPPATLRLRGVADAVAAFCGMAHQLGAICSGGLRTGGSPLGDSPSAGGRLDVVLQLPSSAALSAVAATVLATYRAVPFHNWRHGFDVSHCVFTLVSGAAGAGASLSPIDRLAVLVAALAHDVDHPGVSNGFEVNSLSELALTYNNESVLEHHHAATLFRLLLRAPPPGEESSPGAGQQQQQPPDAAAGAEAVAAPPPPAHRGPPPVRNALGLSRPAFTQLRRVAVAGILGTDMARHPAMMDVLHAIGSGVGVRVGRAAALSADELSAVLLHSADLSAPLCPDFRVTYEWSERCNAEFAAQAAAEAAAGLPSVPFMTALATPADRARQQLVFLDCVIAPLWAAVGEAFPEVAGLAAALPANRDRYAALAEGAEVPEVAGVPWPPPPPPLEAS